MWGAMSGRVAQWGDMEFNGARQAIKDINASGGIKGDKLVGVVFIDVRRRLGGGGTEVANNVLNAIIDDFVGDRDRLFRIAGVVIFDANQFVAFMKRNAKTIVAGVVALAISHAAMAKDIKVAVVGAMSGPVAQWGDME
jgi:ABC-type branched-subunit amino acid transport system substrate-binding protein